MRNSRNFASSEEFYNQTNINQYLTKEQIEQLQEDGISVSESELAKLHHEVMKEQGITLEESIDYETRLFGTKNKTSFKNKNTSKNTSISNNNKSLNINKNSNSININKNKSLNINKKFA